MVRRRGPMLQNFLTPRAMSVFIVLPLLLAHRPPIHARPRASILRRMPMFYGKRDPALASPSSAASFSQLPPSPYLLHAKAVLEDFMDDYHHPDSRAGAQNSDSPARSGAHYHHDSPARFPPGQKRSVKMAKRGGQGFGGGGDAGDRPPWMTSSLLLTRLQDNPQRDALDDGSANIFDSEAPPLFLAPKLPLQSGGYRSPARLGSEERLRKKLKSLSAALQGRNADAYGDVPQPDEGDRPYLIPVEVSDKGDNDGDVGDLYHDVWLDTTALADDDDGDDDYEDSDGGDVVFELMDPETEEDAW